MAFYLDPVTRDTGALQLIPGASRLSDSPRCRRKVAAASLSWRLRGSFWLASLSFWIASVVAI